MECGCKICERSKNFKNHLKNIPEKYKEPKEFFVMLFDHIYEIEEELDVFNIYMDNLKRLYPEVYREIKTLKKLEKSEAKFVEYTL